MYEYEHKVKYYETDKMGITHHSNYIRFMEEARVAWMENMGWSYKKCEDLELYSPVLAVTCDYKKNTTFDDVIRIKVKLKKYNGLRLTVGYEMYLDGNLAAVGESQHCFVNKNGIPVRMKKEQPQFHEVLSQQLEQ